MIDKKNGRNISKKQNKIRIKKFSKRNRRRLSFIFLIFIVCFCVLLIRLIQINIKDGDTYEKNVMSLLNYDGQSIPYRRGDITDRNKTVLATSEKIYNLVLDAYVITHSNIADGSQYVAQTIEKYFGISEADVWGYLENQSDNRYIILKRKMTYDEKRPYDDYKLELSEQIECLSDEIAEETDDAIKTDMSEQRRVLENTLSAISSSIWFEESYKRVYPYSTLACDMIGFTDNHNSKGLWGLECYYDDMLTGIDGRKYGYLDTDVNLQEVTEEPQNGLTVVSTIDINIQRIAEKYIDDFMQETGAKNVAALVMDPNNGEILGMASAPVFDLNNPRDLTIAGYTQDKLDNMTNEKMSEALYSVWRNFIVNDSYEPGSTVKPMTVAYALEQALVSDTDTFYCDGGMMYKNGVWVSCNAVHGMLTLEETLMYSCNDAMMQIAEKIGKDDFLRMQRMFGLGQLTGIDLPGEDSIIAFMYNEDNMGPVELGTSSFGQGFNLTMIQYASAFCSLVNGGHYYQPHVVSEIQADNGNTVKVFDKTLMRTTISEATSKWIREALYRTVADGTGRYAAVSGYRIGGKTGTAEKVPRGGPQNLVSFVGAAPIDDPQVVVYVIVDEPHLEHQGQSSLASKIAGQIFAEVLPYMQIFPTEQMESSQIDEAQRQDNEDDQAIVENIEEEADVSEEVSANGSEDAVSDENGDAEEDVDAE